MNFCIIDTETTGLDPKTDRVLEVASVITNDKEVLGMWATLVDGRPCNPQTSAIHGITDAELVGSPSIVEALLSLNGFADRFGAPIFTAHNEKFDRGFLFPDDGPWLCTKRLAQHLFPDAPGYSNQVLRYWFIDQGFAKPETFGIGAHRALGDSLVTANNLRVMVATPQFIKLEFRDPASLIAYAQSPIKVTKWPNGQYFGQPIESAPKSYIDWCLKLPNLDADLRSTLVAL